MANEIKRNTWTRFCKTFSAANQYRPTQIKLKSNNGQPETTSLMPFLGVAVSKKGRLIEAIQFYAGRAHADSVAEPILTVKDPDKITLNKDKNGLDCRLRIRSRDGTEVCLDLVGERQPVLARQLIEKVAYSIYERRGYTSGSDANDWFEAEKIVRNAESYLTK